MSAGNQLLGLDETLASMAGDADHGTMDAFGGDERLIAAFTTMDEVSWTFDWMTDHGKGPIAMIASQGSGFLLAQLIRWVAESDGHVWCDAIKLEITTSFDPGSAVPGLDPVTESLVDAMVGMDLRGSDDMLREAMHTCVDLPGDEWTVWFDNLRSYDGLVRPLDRVRFMVGGFAVARWAVETQQEMTRTKQTVTLKVKEYR